MGLTSFDHQLRGASVMTQVTAAGAGTEPLVVPTDSVNAESSLNETNSVERALFIIGQSTKSHKRSQ
jgi:hypothetical protein